MKTIAIIGAGASGIMAAATILENTQGQPYHIHIYEKNASPGKKVIISGGGRCNVTTGINDKKILLTKYTRGAEFIKKAFGKFSPKKCYEWFESHGVPLKCERDNRVFPVSDDGTEIVEVFENLFAKHRNRITLHYSEGVDMINYSEFVSESSLLLDPEINSGGPVQQEQGSGKFLITTKKGTYETDIVVITTGGNAYSKTGSTGDGYGFARSLGHSITQLGPSLSSFLTKEAWTHELSGLAFASARIDTLTAPLLLTHFGISGPLAFMFSSEIAWETLRSDQPKKIQFSPISEMGFAEWENFLKEQFQVHPKKLITNILADTLPHRFAEGFIREFFSPIENTFPVSIGKIDREKIARLLGEGIPLTLMERRPGDEFVTAGGVDTSEIYPETMESRILKNLYFAGEILNVDGYTGGFSLQICWASGYVAGKDIVENMK